MPINVLSDVDFKPRTAVEARDALGRKIALTSDEFDRLTAEQRNQAFRIATVQNARLIQRAREILERGVEQGTSWTEIRRELMRLFDIEGIPAPALHRIRLVFHQNTMHAYSVARRETLDKPHIARVFPYRRYMTVGNGTPGVRNVRPEHAALHGLVFPWDDAFWDHFTPPWDYGCRCTFLALTAGQVEGRGVTVWTYRGGTIRPLPQSRQPSGQQRRGSIRMKPKPGFGSGRIPRFDLSGLDADLRKAVKERMI